MKIRTHEYIRTTYKQTNKQDPSQGPRLTAYHPKSASPLHANLSPLPTSETWWTLLISRRVTCGDLKCSSEYAHLYHLLVSRQWGSIQPTQRLHPSASTIRRQWGSIQPTQRLRLDPHCSLGKLKNSITWALHQWGYRMSLPAHCRRAPKSAESATIFPTTQKPYESGRQPQVHHHYIGHAQEVTEPA